MKAYTNLEQSRKLAEFLPVESADMRYGYIAPYEFSDRKYDGGYDMIPYHKDFFDRCSNFSANEYDDELPCLSWCINHDCSNNSQWQKAMDKMKEEKFYCEFRDCEVTYRKTCKNCIVASGDEDGNFYCPYYKK